MKDEEEKVELEETEKKPDVDVEMIDSPNPQNKKPGQAESGFKVIKCTPTPFVVCEQQDSHFIKQIEGGEGIALSMSSLTCRYVTSRPTGTTNLAISEEYLNKYVPRRTAASVQANQSKSAAAMLKELKTQKTGNDGEGTVVAGVYVNSQPLRVKNKKVLDRQQAEAVGDQGQS